MKTDKQMEKNGKRLVSLDVMRGLTVAMMILVNNGYGDSFAQLRHAKWNGMTVCDLVFPFFLFMMGISTYLSLRRRSQGPAGGFSASPEVLQKIFRRAALLFLIGLGINWFEHAIGGDVLCFGHLRLWAVLQRIALCYLAASLFAVYADHKYTIPTIVGLLAVYSVVLVAGNGYAYDAGANILAQVDLRLFGYDHLYHKSPVDPEGLLSTLPAIAHTLIGFVCGGIITNSAPDNGRQASGRRDLLVWGLALVATGLVLSLWLPLNKRIWSPTYVLVSCGLAMLLLHLIIFMEHNTTLLSGGKPRGGLFFLVFGMNPLFLYVLSELMAIVFGHFGISDQIFRTIHSAVASPEWASLCYALTFVLLNWIVGYALYRRRIFIKL